MDITFERVGSEIAASASAHETMEVQEVQEVQEEEGEEGDAQKALCDSTALGKLTGTYPETVVSQSTASASIHGSVESQPAQVEEIDPIILIHRAYTLGILTGTRPVYQDLQPPRIRNHVLTGYVADPPPPREKELADVLDIHLLLELEFLDSSESLDIRRAKFMWMTKYSLYGQRHFWRHIYWGLAMLVNFLRPLSPFFASEGSDIGAVWDLLNTGMVLQTRPVPDWDITNRPRSLLQRVHDRFKSMAKKSALAGNVGPEFEYYTTKEPLNFVGPAGAWILPKSASFVF